jgi:misacylated tRNA(Ala) deacylase
MRLDETGGGHATEPSSTSAPLYAEDSYLKEFDAEVVKAGPRFTVLDRTAFYPESGGQPSDTGSLSIGPRNIRVIKVLRRGRDIFHYLDGDVEVGEFVHGKIDWAARLLNMRRHSGEHLLTGLFERSDAGPKVYSDLTRLEFQPSNLDESLLRRVEAEFDAVVDENIPIRIYYVARGEVDAEGDARKMMFLDKISSDVDRLRIVEIPGYARTFCFGTHVKGTQEIGRLRKLELSEGKKLRKIVHFTLD